MSLKIAVFASRYIGDTVLTTPFLKQLRVQYPDAIIDVYLSPVVQPLMAGCPDLDRAIAFDIKKAGCFRTINHLKLEHYTHAYVLKRSFSAALLPFLAGIPNRIGFDTDFRGALLTTKVAYQPKKQHEAQCYLDLLPSVTSLETVAFTSWISRLEQEQVFQRFLPGKVGPFVVLHATSTNPAKCWPANAFRVLLKQILATTPVTVLFFGTRQDVALYDDWINAMSIPERHRCVNLSGQTTVRETVALLHSARLMVGNDSGMTHLASLAGVPVVALFGPSDPQQWRPLGKDVVVMTRPDLACRPCRLKISCDDRYPCLTEISPEQVMAACKPYLMTH